MAKRKRADEQEREPPPQTEDLTPKSKASKTPGTAFEIPVENKKAIQCERHGLPDSKSDLIFTQGAGGGLEAPAMQDFAAGFSETNGLVMFKGNMNLKSRVSSFHRVMEHEGCQPALGGRSMGARAACLAAQESEGKVEALVLVSFPLIGAQKGDSREQVLLHLPEGIDVLFISGSEDTMCDLGDLCSVVGKMKARSWIAEVEGADHGMALKQKAGIQALRKKTGEIAAQWLKERDESKRFLTLKWDDEGQFAETQGWHEGEPDSGEFDAAAEVEDATSTSKEAT